MKEDLKKVICGFFWESGAIKVSVDKPFKMTSGKYTPFYIDCRMLISFPLQRDIITTYAQWICEKKQIKFDYIAGGETAGIPFAAWLAEKMGKPFIYVRKEPKGHGTASQLEGKIDGGESVLLYEDLITDGGSKIAFIDGIRNAGCIITDCLVLLDRKQGGNETLNRKNVNLFSLVTVDDCLRAGQDHNYLTSKEGDIINEYIRKNRNEA